MSTLSESDITTLQNIGYDTIVNIVALCVEAVLYSKRRSHSQRYL